MFDNWSTEKKLWVAALGIGVVAGYVLLVRYDNPRRVAYSTTSGKMRGLSRLAGR